MTMSDELNTKKRERTSHCKRHPYYKARRRPVVDCPECWEAWRAVDPIRSRQPESRRAYYKFRLRRWLRAAAVALRLKAKLP